MGQVTELKYNGYNGYTLNPNDWIYASKFDCQYLSHITAQFVVIKPIGTIASGQLEVRWIDEDGAPIGGTSKYVFTPTQLWKRHVHTFEVPEGARYARTHLEGGAQGYTFACHKVEAGEIATAYSDDDARKMAFMTSEGAYLGTLSANQIISGEIVSRDGKMYIKLDAPSEIAMDGATAKLRISPAYPIRVLNASNQPIAGLMTKNNETMFFASALTDKENPDVWFRAGEYVFVDPVDGPYTVSGLFAFSTQNPDVPRTWLALTDFGFQLQDDECSISSSGSILAKSIFLNVNDNNGVGHLEVASDFMGYNMGVDYKLIIDELESSFNQGNHAIGVDDTGPYYVKNGSKQYF